MTAQLPCQSIRRFRAMAFAVLAVVGGAAGVAPAGAQPAGECGSSGTGGLISNVDVEVTSPAPGSVVTGSRVPVRGTASVALVGALTQVQVSLGGATRTQTYEPSSEINFDLAVDTADLSTGPSFLSVTACGPLARGMRQFTVVYQRAPASSTTTVTAPATTAVGAVGGASTTTVAAPTTVASQSTTTVAGQTTLTSTPPTTAFSPPATTIVEPRRTSARETVVLSDDPDEGSGGSPLWVGAVVGISGGIGLLFSATSWRRRQQPAPEPLETDLVDVP